MYFLESVVVTTLSPHDFLLYVKSDGIGFYVASSLLNPYSLIFYLNLAFKSLGDVLGLFSGLETCHGIISNFLDELIHFVDRFLTDLVI